MPRKPALLPILCRMPATVGHGAHNMGQGRAWQAARLSPCSTPNNPAAGYGSGGNHHVRATCVATSGCLALCLLPPQRRYHAVPHRAQRCQTSKHASGWAPCPNHSANLSDRPDHQSGAWGSEAVGVANPRGRLPPTAGHAHGCAPRDTRETQCARHRHVTVGSVQAQWRLGPCRPASWRANLLIQVLVVRPNGAIGTPLKKWCAGCGVGARGGEQRVALPSVYFRQRGHAIFACKAAHPAALHASAVRCDAAIHFA